MATTLDPALRRSLVDIVGAAGYRQEPQDLAPFLAEARGRFQGQADLVLLPGTTAEVAAILALCNREGIGAVPQGGNTGLVGGALPGSTPSRPQIVLAAQRLARIRVLDADNYTMTAEAGCVLANLQAAAAGIDRYFPLSLASEGSCQLGGNISSNAGGTNVLRYGNTRDLVLGMEAVLPDGRVFDGLRALRKDNTGYDLKQLFIGAEGTLGFITAATCKLFPRPRGIATAIVAVPTVQDAIALYSRARLGLGDELIAFELMSDRCLRFVRESWPAMRAPLGDVSPWYVLMELASARTQEAVDAQIDEFLAASLEAGLVSDGALARSLAQREEFWSIRHRISDAQKIGGASIKNDISVPVSRIGDFLAQAETAVLQRMPGTRIVAFGHLGDGNLHYNLSQPESMSGPAFLDHWEELTGVVNEVTAALGGSFSAEHGIGLLKVKDLQRWRGGVELELMQAVKRALDPRGIMNPGKVLGSP